MLVCCLRVPCALFNTLSSYRLHWICITTSFSLSHSPLSINRLIVFTSYLLIQLILILLVHIFSFSQIPLYYAFCLNRCTNVNHHLPPFDIYHLSNTCVSVYSFIDVFTFPSRFNLLHIEWDGGVFAAMPTWIELCEI